MPKGAQNEPPQSHPYPAVTAAGRAIYTAMNAINSIKVLLSPFLPFTSEKLHTMLGYTSPLFGEQGIETEKDSLGEHEVLRYYPEKATGHWAPERLQPGRKFQKPEPLFKKLDASIIEEERSRLG